MKKQSLQLTTEKALELYLQGKLTLEGAAHLAELYIGEFLELMRQKGIESNATEDDFNKALEHTRKLLR